MAPKRKPDQATLFVTSPPKRVARDQSFLQRDANLSSSSSSLSTDLQDRVEAHRPEDEDFVLRKYYPPQMSSVRVQAYISGEIPKPIDRLQSALDQYSSFRRESPVGEAVVHWFRSDLRLHDNIALDHAHNLAKSGGKPLVGLFVYSHGDFEAWVRSPARIDFVLRTLKVVKTDLQILGIPLWIEEVEDRREVVGRVLGFCERIDAKRITVNIEYEVDELRRDEKLVREGALKGIAVDAFDDTCVVGPRVLKAKGTGRPFSVYSPFMRAWLEYLHTQPDVLTLLPPPRANPLETKKKLAWLFEDRPFPIPKLNKTLDASSRARLALVWPAGEHEALVRLSVFIREKLSHYADSRNAPSNTGGTSSLSVHLSAGTLSARQCVHAATRVELDEDGNEYIKNSEDQYLPWFSNAEMEHTFAYRWVSEIAWRDFYKQVMVHWPYTVMNIPLKQEYRNIRWEYNEDHFQAWCQGKTGYPIIDAAMRQLNTMKYMHNRCRMIVASFISKHLLLDWRKGEKYFMEQLIDGDFSANNGGWQWAAGSGTDPQPYFRIFNPLLQSEKFDQDGEYIKTWVKELEDVKAPAIHAPFERLPRKDFEKLGYPKPIVEHRSARERALARYKEGLQRGTA